VSIPLAAGAVSTVIFALSTLPMLIKARRSKNLKSYSLGNLLLANLGNVVHSIYVVSLPVGPIWGLHTFYLVTTGLMLLWYVRYSAKRRIDRKKSAWPPDHLGRIPDRQLPGIFLGSAVHPQQELPSE
jgi:uncharacterized protein with PQ loop repeat